MNVLSIRGGGMKGIVPAAILAALEGQIGAIRDQFDLIVGTSTGGILGLALAMGLHASDVLDLYLSHGPGIFARRWMHRLGLFGARYDIVNLRGALASCFRSAPLSRCSNVMVVATDVATRRSCFIKSWKHGQVSLVDAASATAAAPTYFDPVNVEPCGEFDGGLLADGGLFANNPVSFGLTEAVKMSAAKHDFPSIRVVDLACGTPRPATSRTRWGLVNAGELLNLFLDSGMDAAAHQAKVAVNEGYLGVMPELGSASDRMDDASHQNMNALLKAGREQAKNLSSMIARHVAR